VRACSIVICGIRGEHAAQVAFTDDNDMVQTLAAERANQSFGYTILPRGTRTDRPVTNSYRLHPIGEDVSVGAVIVADQIARRRNPGKCLRDLPS
jgi:hypothetical protein